MNNGVAIITGGGSGIGLAAALRLAESGFTVALVGRSRQRLEAALEQVRKVGEGMAVPGDVAKPDEADGVMDRVADHFGRIDVLVNCAGYVRSARLEHLTPAQWHEILDGNLSSAFYTTRAAWPHMARREVSAELGARGVIVNISSMASRDPFPGLAAYGVAKAGLDMLTLMTAREGHEVGIRAVGIAPAAVDTSMFRRLVGAEEGGGGAAVDPAMVLQPDDVARMIVDAVSGSLRHCSGETLFVHRKPA
jgi:NAD(P)-dependent dehydrogenase (short-subunit alcohol dehydrogenase family)